MIVWYCHGCPSRSTHYYPDHTDAMTEARTHHENTKHKVVTSPYYPEDDRSWDYKWKELE